MLHHKFVDLECYPGERYGRRICRVFVYGVDAEETLVAMGLAWAYRENPKYVRDKRIYAVEENAQRARLGLWNASQNIPPWEWRKTCWQRQDCPFGEDH
jgi:endonuclease YncB( thermonuclease family)